jgi:hypothetical protein
VGVEAEPSLPAGSKACLACSFFDDSETKTHLLAYTTFMRALALWVFLALQSFPATGQQFGSSTVILGVGGALPASGYRTTSFHNGPSIAGEYEFGLHRSVAANIGVENFFLNFDNITRNSLAVTRERITLMPFGIRGIAPLAGGRAELFAGAGGAYLWSSEYDLRSYGGEGFLWQLNGGGRIAIDRAKHFRVGATMRFYRDLGRPTQEWFSVTGDVSYRFGR